MVFKHACQYFSYSFIQKYHILNPPEILYISYMMKITLSDIMSDKPVFCT